MFESWLTRTGRENVSNVAKVTRFWLASLNGLVHERRVFFSIRGHSTIVGIDATSIIHLIPTRLTGDKPTIMEGYRVDAVSLRGKITSRRI